MGTTNRILPRPPRSRWRLLPTITVAAAVSLVAMLACVDETTVPVEPPPVEPPPEPTSISVTPANTVLNAPGDTVRLVAEVLDQNGQVIAGFPVSWSSSDPSAATVSESGLVRAVSEGDARITAMAGPVSATAGISVILDVDRAALAAFYHATGGGSAWSCPEWLTDAPLDEWCGVEVGEMGRVTGLNLWRNGLVGFLPPELARLEMLEVVNLSLNVLKGPIPPELGRLAMLRVLDLGFNDLEGPIPPEFGQLEMLEVLDLRYNGVEGSIPVELTTLPRLRALVLGGALLAGPLPPELVNSPELRDLDLSWNEFSGPLPPGFAGMSNLTTLNLYQNPITGPLPEDIGRLSTLAGLNLTSTKMSGPLPHSLTEIEGLDTLLTGGTELCAPVDEQFGVWLRGVRRQRVHPCGGVANETTAYLTQAVQSRLFPVPLVADEEALLRVFVVAPQAAGRIIPPVRATFYRNGTETEVVEIASDSSFIRSEIDESSLASSANVVIPESLIRPGLEMVVEIDPDGTLDPALGVAQRIPETGRSSVDVREMPVLTLTLVPFLFGPAPDSSILEVTGGLKAEDPLLKDIRTLMPVRDLELTVHEPVVTNTTGPDLLLAETQAIRAAEQGQGYYMGTLPETQATYRGHSSYGVGRSSFSIPDSWVMAHELGHNLGLLHSPCGRNLTDSDPSYPHLDGTIGAWGYDFAEGVLVPPGTPDFMSYCDPNWVSEFLFSNMLRYRSEVEAAESAAALAASGPSLLVWGGIEPNGAPFLEPAFVLDAPGMLPRSSGPYSLTGFASDGARLFSLSFDMPGSADGEGGSSFAFAIPAQTSWDVDLARIALSGPDGVFSMDAGTDRPAAIVRDPGTGRVRAILRDLPATMTRGGAVLLLPEPGLELLFSRGLPDAVEWSRR